MKRRGISLAEVLITLFLLGLVLSVTGDLMNRGRNLSSFYRQKSALQQASWALQRLCLQIQGASQIQQPAMNGSSAQLVWVRVRPEASGRLPGVLGATPAPIPAPSPVWDPTAAAWTETVSVYRLDSGDLLWSDPSSEHVLCNGLNQLECSSQDRVLELTATVLVRGRPQQVQLRQRLDSGVQW